MKTVGSKTVPGRQASGTPAHGRPHRLRWALAATLAAIAGLIYFDTTSLPVDHFALLVQGDRVVSIYRGGGRAYRIPLLQHVVLIDQAARPVPIVRAMLPTSDAIRVAIEVTARYAVSDPVRFWQALNASNDKAVGAVDAALRRAMSVVVAGQTRDKILAADGRKALAQAIVDAADAALFDRGLQVRDLRVGDVHVQDR